MTNKPSLYVVERKEVVILVILFVLVTVLAFTMGVKYGENIGLKRATEKQATEASLAEAQSASGGHLGAASTPAGVPATESHGETKTPEATGTPAPADPHAAAAPADAHGAPAAAEKAADSHATTQANPDSPSAGKPIKAGDLQDSDEYLLQALKEAGVERSQSNAKAASPVRGGESSEHGEAGDDSAHAAPSVHGEEGEDSSAVALPSNVKGRGAKASASDEYWVIQVASYPTEPEAKRHAAKLRAQSLEPIIFSGMDSNNGKWYRVALGKYADKDRAGEVARTYKSKGWIGATSFVRKAP